MTLPSKQTSNPETSAAREDRKTFISITKVFWISAVLKVKSTPQPHQNSSALHLITSRSPATSSMGSRNEIEVTIRSARNLKNVNWRKGDLRPYAVAWIDSSRKGSTKVDINHDTDPEWDEKLIIPHPPNLSLRDATLCIDIVHADADEGVKLLIGSARLPLSEVVDVIGIGGKLDRTLDLKHPSGRPQGKLDIRVAVKEQPRYYHPYAQPPPSYGQPYGYSESRYPYGYAPPPAGYPYAGYTVHPSGYPYGRPATAGYPYGAPPAWGPPVGYHYIAPPAWNPYGDSQPAHGHAPSGFWKPRFEVSFRLPIDSQLLDGLAQEGGDLLENDSAGDAAYGGGDDYNGDDF